MARILFSLVVLALVSCNHGTPSSPVFGLFMRVNPNLSPRIVGGQSANIEDYPYQVSIMFDGKHGCGGSIPTTKFILTAAHCFLGESRVSHITIRVGSSDRTSGGQIVKVKNITSHPSFNASSGDYDVAVVELATTLTLGPGVAIIQLPSSSSKFVDGQQCVATGWGRTTAENGASQLQLPSNSSTIVNGPQYEITTLDPDLTDHEFLRQLQVVTLPLITTKTCQNYNQFYERFVSSRMICAGSKGKDTCSGDSGGPLVSNGVQVGIVSWGGTICGQSSAPGVYTKITSVLSFINGVIN